MVPATQGLGGGALEDGGGELEDGGGALEDGGGALDDGGGGGGALAQTMFTVLPRASSVPPGGFVEMTSPAARVASSLDLGGLETSVGQRVVASAMLSR